MKLSHTLLALSLASSLVACGKDRPKKPHVAGKKVEENKTTDVDAQIEEKKETQTAAVETVEIPAEKATEVVKSIELAPSTGEDKKSPEDKKPELPPVKECHEDEGLFYGTLTNEKGEESIAEFKDAECKVAFTKEELLARDAEEAKVVKQDYTSTQGNQQAAQ